MSNKVILNFLPPQTLPDLILRHDMKVKWIWRLISKLSICWSFWPCYFWLKPAASGFNMLNYWLPEKRRRHSRRFFLGPVGSWLGFAQPACFTLRHGRLGLIGVFPFILLFTKVFPLVTIVLPFGHQCLSLWSPRSIPLVTKGFPFGHQGSTSPFTFFWSEVRMKNKLMDRTE